jgi:hypothetical protein
VKESDIVYEVDRFWVLRDLKRHGYTVFESGITHSTSDSTYPLDDAGLSLAKARVDYLAKHRKELT